MTDDLEEEIPELVSTGSIIHDFDKEEQVPHSENLPLNITRN